MSQPVVPVQVVSMLMGRIEELRTIQQTVVQTTVEALSNQNLMIAELTNRVNDQAVRIQALEGALELHLGSPSSDVAEGNDGRY